MLKGMLLQPGGSLLLENLELFSLSVLMHSVLHGMQVCLEKQALFHMT